MVLFMILEAIAALRLPYSSVNDKNHTVDFYCENHTLLLEQLYYVACFINFFGIIVITPICNDCLADWCCFLSHYGLFQ